MRLTLSNRSPWNTEYFNEEKEVVYNVYAPATLGTRVITICRPTPATGPSIEAEVVAEIEWHTFRTSKIRFLGQEWPVDAFFRKRGIGLMIGRYGSRDLLCRILTLTIVVETECSPRLTGKTTCGNSL